MGAVIDVVPCFGVYSPFSLPNKSFTVLQTALNDCNDHQQLFHLHLPDRSIYQISDWFSRTSVHECGCGQLFAANKLVNCLCIGTKVSWLHKCTKQLNILTS